MQSGSPLPKFVVALICVPFFIAGPGVLTGGVGWVLWRSSKLSERANAEVVEVRRHEYAGTSGGARADSCPVFRFKHGGKTQDTESSYCHADFYESVGQKHDIRFDPSEPSYAVPDSSPALENRARPHTAAAPRRPMRRHVQLAGAPLAGPLRRTVSAASPN